MKRILVSLSLFVLAVLALTLSSCRRYELELYYTGKAKVHVDVDWTTRFGETPSGMTIMLAKDGDAITFTDVTNDVSGYDLDLEPGTYKMLIFNRTSGEFGSMRFFQMKSFTEAFAIAQEMQRQFDFWDTYGLYGREPESIGCAVDTFTVLPEMIDGEFQFVNYRDKVEKDLQVLRLQEVVEPMTTELNVRVKIIGYKYMASVVGNISGMADGFLLTQTWRRTQTNYQLLDTWSRKAAPDESDSLKSVGYINTKIRTFGLPHGREMLAQRLPDHNVLSLCFTLIDGTQHVFRYPVGDKIKYKQAELNGYFSKVDVTLDLDLEITNKFYTDDEVPNLPYAQPSGTGAFDAEVSDWGDDEIIDIPM